MKKLELVVGVLAPPISKQLRDQGLDYRNGNRDAAHLDILANTLVDLYIWGILSGSESDKANKRLIKHIASKCVVIKEKQT
jgi:hypothetical protein